MYVQAQPMGTSELPCSIIAATCCADCPAPPCVQACPRGIDVHGVLKVLLQNHPFASRMMVINATQDLAEGAID